VFGVDALQLLQARAEVPLEFSVGIDARVLGFTLAAALATGLVFGTAPAIQVLRENQFEGLKDHAPAVSSGGGRALLQNALVVPQLALSLVLLTGAGLLVQSLRNTLDVDPGFDLRDGVILPVNLGFTQYGEAEGKELHRRLLRDVASLPRVESVALSAFLPLGLVHGHHDVAVEGYEPAPDEPMLVKRNTVSAGYFETMGIRVLSGRAIDERDTEDAEPVAVINETMARRFWPNQDPIGRTVRADLGIAYTVVGVVEDGKYTTLRDPPEPYLVIPLGQGEYPQRVNLVVRTAGDPAAMIAPLSAEVRRLAPNVPESTVLTVPQYLEYSVGAAKAPALLVGAFGMLALALAAVGLYGVMSYSVGQRRREFGVRIALGATQAGIVTMVLRGGLKTTLAGMAIGIVLAIVGTRLLAGFLYDVSPLDPVVLILALLTLLAVGPLASFVPARSASSTDPVEALRLE
jgi:predicted permease